jgi:hypothetical protein
MRSHNIDGDGGAFINDTYITTLRSGRGPFQDLYDLSETACNIPQTMDNAQRNPSVGVMNRSFSKTHRPMNSLSRDAVHQTSRLRS